MPFKNVYLVLTEYQLLQALNLATEFYNDSKYLNIIYIVRTGKRLKGIAKTNKNINETVVLIFLDQISPREIADQIIEEKPNHFLIFQCTTPLNIYLGYTIAKQGAEISLGPDGYSAYAVFNKRFKFLSFVKDSFVQNKYLIKNKLLSPKIHAFGYVYGSHNFINNLWITHPDQYNHRGANKVTIKKLPKFNDDCLNIVKKIFNFNNIFPTHDVIYFFNQPFWSGLLVLEYQFLIDVLASFPKREVVLKLHPLTSQEMKNKYRELDRVQIIESDVPAEILLLSLQNCIVYSGWSTVLITENTKCNYYFNYPFYKKSGHKNLNQLEIPALKHINMIESPNEMKFQIN